MDVDSWARALADHLQWHMDSERDVLTEYGHMAEATSDERVRYLIHLILDDEVRHHRLFQEMVNWLRAETESRRISGPMVPDHSAAEPDPRREELRRKTLELLEFERDDERELRELRKQVTEVSDTAWWEVLIETMEHDTRKHVRLLEFIREVLAR